MANRNSQLLGKNYEQQACRFLEENGMLLLERNYRCFSGEIDLIMQDKDEIVFIEVRARMDSDFATAVESVNYHKQRKLVKTATHYLQKHECLDQAACRFDVIGIMNGKIEWIKDAFSIENFEV